MLFEVSVVIPAYNVEKYIEKTINSALIQPEVSEVVVVNDGSSDDTEKILDKLKSTNSKIKVYHHENKTNKGRSATRNLGILKATKNIIAFLDADDYYVDNRFTNDKKMFENNLKIEGVYNAVGFEFYRQVSDAELEQHKLCTLTKKIHPDKLFDAIVASKYGYLHLNGLTVKKSIFTKVGLFNETLVVAEDSDLIFKMALICKLMSSVIDIPLAKRGIHDSNIFTNEDLYKEYNVKLFESLVNWAYKKKISFNKIDTLLNWLWFFKFKQNKGLINYIVYWAYLFFKTPNLFFSYLSVKYFPIVRLRQKLFPILYKSQKNKCQKFP